MDADFGRTGILNPAVEPHRVQWLNEPHAEDGSSVFLDERAVRAQVHSPTYLAGRWMTRACAIGYPAELARVVAELGGEIHERSRVTELDTPGDGVVAHTEAGLVRAPRAVLATNVFPSLLERNRQGLADLDNQFHYYRLSGDNGTLFGGYAAAAQDPGCHGPRLRLLSAAGAGGPAAVRTGAPAPR